MRRLIKSATTGGDDQVWNWFDKIGSRAREECQVSENLFRVPKRLDRDTKHQQHERDGGLLRERRCMVLPTKLIRCEARCIY